MDSTDLAAPTGARLRVDYSLACAPRISRVVRVLGAQERHSYLDATELLVHANEVSGEIIDRTQADYDEQMRQGYEAGLLAGRAAAVAECLKASAERGAALLSLQPELARLVTRVVTEMLGDTPEADRVALLVNQALRQLRAVSGRVGIRVHPGCRAHVERELARWQASYPDAAFAVIGDIAMPADSCRVEAAGGAIEGALGAQLAALGTALGISTEAAPDGASRIVPGISPEIGPQIAPGITSGITPEITSEIRPDIASDMGRDIASDEVAGDLRDSVPNVASAEVPHV